MFGMMKYSRIVATFRRCDVERKSRRHGVAVVRLCTSVDGLEFLQKMANRI
jgi:hypothetical protein